MTDYEKALQDLAEVGFTPGCLIKTRSQKSFWQEWGVPTVERLQLENGSYKEWVRGEKYAKIQAGTILMFLGLLNREVNKGVVNERRGVIEVSSYGSHRLMCFLHEQKIVWWDYESIDGGAPALLDKFEVLDCGEQTEEKADSG